MIYLIIINAPTVKNRIKNLFSEIHIFTRFNLVMPGPLTGVEMLGWALWCLSFAWEHVADMQKLNYVK